MKYNSKHFKFRIKSRVFKSTVWAKYYELKKKAALTDQDKYWIKQFRSQINTNQFKLIGTHIPTNTTSEWVIKKDLSKEKIPKKHYLDALISAVSAKRVSQKTINSTAKTYEGASYITVGGVFTKPASIAPLAHFLTTNDPMACKKPKHANKNYIGIELEFNKILNGPKAIEIGAKLKLAGLAKYVDVGEDGSCGWEVRVLLLESEFELILNKILAVLTGMGFTTNAQCGTHVHLDMRSRDVKVAYANLFNTQAFLRKFLARGRKSNEYCKKNKAKTFDDQLAVNDRRYAINTQAYREHRTLEIRMHQGTLISKELVPWIHLLLKIVNHTAPVVDSVSTLKQAKKQFDLDPELSQDLQERIVTIYNSKKVEPERGLGLGMSRGLFGATIAPPIFG